jgi:hypothetical protein
MAHLIKLLKFLNFCLVAARSVIAANQSGGPFDGTLRRAAPIAVIANDQKQPGSGH